LVPSTSFVFYFAFFLIVCNLITLTLISYIGSLNISIYHDGLTSGWAVDGSTNLPYNLSVTSPRYGNNGSSLSVDLNNYGFLYLDTSSVTFYATDFGSLNFYAYVSDVKYLMNVS
jgi:hypothetical protein